MTRAVADNTPGATVIAVASGKGGVGKTSLVVNVAVALARLKNRVVVLDGDFSLGNVDVLLGLTPASHIGHILAGERTLDQVLVDGPCGIRILPASSGLQDLTALTPIQRGRFNLLIEQLRRTSDFVLVDTATGISDNVLGTLLMAERVILVTSVDPSAIVDAYATAKVLSTTSEGHDIGIVVNGVSDAEEAAVTFRQLDTAARRFLQQSLRYYGYVPQDSAMQLAASMQRAVVDLDPHASSSRSFRMLASRIAGMGPAHNHGLRLAGRELPDASVSEVPQCA